LDDTYLCQVIENPTRKSNTFDLILANLHNQITHIKLIPGISDFDSVCLTFPCVSSIKTKAKESTLV